MKVTLESTYKDYMTVNEMEIAKEIIKEEKEDGWTAKDAAEYLVREALKDKDDCLAEVLSAKAYATTNCRAWNAYSDHSQNIDIYIWAKAETGEGFIKVGGYLTDIWQSGMTDYREHIFSQYFTEAEA